MSLNGKMTLKPSLVPSKYSTRRGTKARFFGKPGLTEEPVKKGVQQLCCTRDFQPSNRQAEPITRATISACQGDVDEKHWHLRLGSLLSMTVHGVLLNGVSRKDVKYLVGPGQKKLQVVSYEKWGDRTNELVQAYNKLIMREGH